MFIAVEISVDNFNILCRYLKHDLEPHKPHLLALVARYEIYIFKPSGSVSSLSLKPLRIFLTFPII